MKRLLIVFLALLAALVFWWHRTGPAEPSHEAAGPDAPVRAVPAAPRPPPYTPGLLPAPGAQPAGATSSVPPQAQPDPETTPAQTDAIPGEYVLQFASREVRDAFARIARNQGFTVLDRMDLGHALRLRAPGGGQLSDLLGLAPKPVAWSPNLRIQIPTRSEPDPLEAPDTPYRGFGENAVAWLGLEQTMPERGGGVTIAVLDTGLARNLGGQRVNLTGSPPGGHGDAVAAILQQVAPAASLMDVQVMAADGTGDTFTLAKGIVEAVDRGANILNLSMGTRGDHPLLAEAVQYAADRGVLVVASAGNEGVTGVSFPAAYPGVLGVGAVDAEARHLYFSNRGDDVDLVAPGVGIAVPGPDGTTRYFNGTSASAPFVAGVAAILQARLPHLAGASVGERLLSTANDTGAPGRDARTGAGILSPVRALERDQADLADMALLHPFVLQGDAGEVQQVELAAQNRGTTTLPQVEMRIVAGGVEKRVLFENIEPGMTVAYPLEAKPYLDAEGALDVQVEVLLPGDVRPGDNALRSVLLPR